MLTFFIVKNLGFLAGYRRFRWKITKISNRGLKIFLLGKIFSLVPSESLTLISLPESPDKASFCQEVWANYWNFYVFTTSVPNMRVDLASLVTNLGSGTCRRSKSNISRWQKIFRAKFWFLVIVLKSAKYRQNWNIWLAFKLVKMYNYVVLWNLFCLR